MVPLILEPLLLRGNDENGVVITLQNKVFHNTLILYAYGFSCNNPSKQGLPQHALLSNQTHPSCNNPSKQGLPQHSHGKKAIFSCCNNPSKQGLPQLLINKY